MAHTESRRSLTHVLVTSQVPESCAKRKASQPQLQVGSARCVQHVTEQPDDHHAAGRLHLLAARLHIPKPNILGLVMGQPKFNELVNAC